MNKVFKQWWELEILFSDNKFSEILMFLEKKWYNSWDVSIFRNLLKLKYSIIDWSNNHLNDLRDFITELIQTVDKNTICNGKITLDYNDENHNIDNGKIKYLNVINNTVSEE